MSHRALRYGWRWTVNERFNVSVEGARQGGVGGVGDVIPPVDAGTDPDVTGAQHSLQVRGGVSF